MNIFESDTVKRVLRLRPQRSLEDRRRAYAMDEDMEGLAISIPVGYSKSAWAQLGQAGAV